MYFFIKHKTNRQARLNRKWEIMLQPNLLLISGIKMFVEVYRAINRKCSFKSLNGEVVWECRIKLEAFSVININIKDRCVQK